MEAQLIIDLHVKAKGITITAGTLCEVTQHEMNGYILIRPAESEYVPKGLRILTRAEWAHKYFNEFIEFDMDMLQEAAMDGRCPSLTGVDVEPDGYDSYGFPSILIAAGWC